MPLHSSAFLLQVIMWYLLSLVQLSITFVADINSSQYSVLFKPSTVNAAVVISMSWLIHYSLLLYSLIHSFLLIYSFSVCAFIFSVCRLGYTCAWLIFPWAWGTGKNCNFRLCHSYNDNCYLIIPLETLGNNKPQLSHRFYWFHTQHSLITITSQTWRLP